MDLLVASVHLDQPLFPPREIFVIFKRYIKDALDVYILGRLYS